ncbi:hypothetical protein ACLB2K_068874 [Fragaria x ananassa]
MLISYHNMQVKDHSYGKTDRKCIKTCLKEVSNGLSTSKELVKVLTRVSGLEEQQHSLNMPLLTALRAELDRVRIQVHQLIREQRSNCKEIEYLMRHFAEEKAAWKSKEREKIRAVVACIAEELEVEKKLRKQTERLNKKLGKELENKNVALSKEIKELEREKRAKEIFEQVCDELAVGMGEDRAQVEELKRESEKVREEVEKEREMLQLADVLREERVQMNLSEAKYHFEEKNAAVEQLKNELEGYLRSHKGEGSGDSPDFKRIKELEAYLKKINFGSIQSIKEGDDGMEVAFREECDEEDSARKLSPLTTSFISSVPSWISQSSHLPPPTFSSPSATCHTLGANLSGPSSNFMKFNDAKSQEEDECMRLETGVLGGNSKDDIDLECVEDEEDGWVEKKSFMSSISNSHDPHVFINDGAVTENDNRYDVGTKIQVQVSL